MAQWTSQDKVRPGAYLNFSAVPRTGLEVGDRGIGMLALPLSWGAEDTLIDVYSTDLSDGSSLAKVGITAFSEESKELNLMLQNCYLARVYRLDTGGAKASGANGNLTIQAKYPGEMGNAITVVIADSDGQFVVTTYVDGARKDQQAVALINELENNDFVDFSGIGVLEVSAGIILTGGMNGTIDLPTAYPAWMALAKKSKWHTMALTRGNTSFASLFADFAKGMRETERRYIQVVLANYSNADHPGVINSDCGAVVNGVTVTTEEATAWVAGITAGASVSQSNVSRQFVGATRILNERTNTEIIDALKRGMFILSTNQRGEIVVEDDINSLHTFTDELSEDFKFNQVIRVIDEIGESISDSWEQMFKGRGQNNENGRTVFKAELLTYLNTLQNQGAIENFAGASDVLVKAGTKKDSVRVDISVQPVTALSKLYANIYVI